MRNERGQITAPTVQNESAATVLQSKLSTGVYYNYGRRYRPLGIGGINTHYEHSALQAKYFAHSLSSAPNYCRSYKRAAHSTSKYRDNTWPYLPVLAFAQTPLIPCTFARHLVSKKSMANEIEIMSGVET